MFLLGGGGKMGGRSNTHTLSPLLTRVMDPREIVGSEYT